MIKIIKRYIQNIPMPIVVRITAWYGIFLSIVFIGLFSVMFLFSGSYAKYTMRDNLIENVNKAASKEKKFKGYDDGVFVSKIDREGYIIEGDFPPEFPNNIEYSGEGLKEIEIDKKKYYYYDVISKRRDIEPPSVIRGVMPMDYAYNVSSAIILLLGVLMTVTLIIIIVLGYKLIKRAFLPVQRISNTANEIGSKNDLSRRIEVGIVKDEIQSLSIAFNTMLENLEKASIKEKNFTSDVSHELRTPISVIQAESEYAYDCGETVEEMKESLEVINKQAKKMSNIVNQLLELSRMDRTNSLLKERVNLSDLINSVVSDYKKIAIGSDIILTGNIVKDVYVEGNKLLLQRAIENLISNAVKFTESKVDISLSVMDGNSCISVTDDGIGIKEKDVPYVWDRFFQADTSRNKNMNKGSGLGLSIVSQIVHLHNGQAVLESTESKGCVFKIFIPLSF